MVLIYTALNRLEGLDLRENGVTLSHQITKEDFDSKARALLGEGNVQLHNEFLFSILVKCQTGAHPGLFYLMPFLL